MSAEYVARAIVRAAKRGKPVVVVDRPHMADARRQDKADGPAEGFLVEPHPVEDGVDFQTAVGRQPRRKMERVQ